MSLWRDRVIELLLPVQVAAMNFNKSSDKDDASRPHTAASKRSFARSMAASRPKTRPTVDRSEELKAETQNETKDLENFEKNIVRSRDSLPATPEDNTEPPSDAAPRHLRSPLTIGYPNLQTLILEGNHISTPDIFDTLGALPKCVHLKFILVRLLTQFSLVTLNLNNNHIQSLNYFLAHGLSPKRALAEDPASLQKYSGFQNLEELAIKNNQIAAMENIIGLICLPALKRVHLGGNPVVTNVNFRSLAASNGKSHM